MIFRGNFVSFFYYYIVFGKAKQILRIHFTTSTIFSPNAC